MEASRQEGPVSGEQKIGERRDIMGNPISNSTSNSVKGVPFWARGKSGKYMEEVLRSVIRKRGNPPADFERLVVEKGLIYQVRFDVLAAISMLETNWWNFGGNVTADMNNPAGIRCQCKKYPLACRQGTNGETYGAYKTLEDGIKHFAAHMFCYTSPVDWANARPADPCWSEWYSQELRKAKDYGLEPDSIDACYSLWRDGALPPTEGCKEAVASIKAIVAEFEKAAKELAPDNPNKPSLPSWLLPVGIGLLAIFLWGKRARQ
jgi:hypothetical protein